MVAGVGCAIVVVYDISVGTIGVGHPPATNRAVVDAAAPIIITTV